MSQYIKLTNKTANHNGLQLKEGLNVDKSGYIIVPSNPYEICKRGGICFTTPYDLCTWLNYREDLELVWEVEIPSGAQVVRGVDKSKADQIILKNPTPIEKYLMTVEIVEGKSEAIKWAVKHGQLECLQYLYQQYNYSNEIRRASQYCQFECLKYLHHNGYYFMDNLTSLEAAESDSRFKKGYIECILYLYRIEM